METIDPERLRRIRAARGRSQHALAQVSNVSVRQIVRLEKADGPVDVRDNTISRLAKALEVGTDVLSGAEPLPNGLTVSSDEDPLTAVAPAAMTELRRRRNWSRRQLSEASGVSEQQIQKVEKSAEAVRVATRVATRLAKALAVPVPVLSGEATIAPGMPIPADIGVSVKTTPGLRLAYDLVERRYGATVKDLFGLAPLLFVLLAEGSLAARRRKLEMARQASDTLEELAKDHPTLYFGKRQSVVWQGIDEEQASIDAADVLGRRVWDTAWSMVHHFPEDDTNITPFADYLAELAKEIDRRDLVNFDSLLLVDQGLVPWGANPYEVCRGELGKVAGMSREALAAVEWGDVRLSEIPQELMAEDAWQRRQYWLESKLSEDARQYARSRELVEYYEDGSPSLPT